MSPARPGEKTFEELVALLQEHYNPKPSETVQRAKFHSRVRKQGETIADFVAELRALAACLPERDVERQMGSTVASFSRDYWLKKNSHL